MAKKKPLFGVNNYEEKHGRILELIVWCVTPRGNPI